MIKTNAMRLLDRAGLTYEILEYDLPVEGSFGLKVSEVLGMEAGACYKTLGTRCGHDTYICVIPVDKELDLKKAARNIGVKDLEMIHVKDLLKEVGYERGSVTPIGVKKNKGIYFDEEVLRHDIIEISGGLHGVGLKIDTEGLLGFLKAEVRDLCRR